MFNLCNHHLRPGDRVELLIFNHPDHKTGVVKEIVQNEAGTTVRILRADGRMVDFDPYLEAEEVRLAPGSAYCYAMTTGMDYIIHVIKFLRERYDLTLLQAKEVIAKEAATTVEDIEGRLAKELEPVLH